ncbi:unnamed protein product, partial [Cyprideis torosa]
MSLIENIQREDLNALEEANGLRRLIDEFGLTHQQTAEAVGRSRAAVSNLLRLLELMPEVKEMLEHREIDMGHARALLPLTNEQVQLQAAQKVVKRQLSVRDTERMVKKILEGAVEKITPVASPDVQRLERKLSDQLGAKVAIRYNQKGRGRMVIEYNSLDE